MKRFFSSKKDGNMASYAGIDRESFLENRQRFFEKETLRLESAVFATQTHSDHIAVIRGGDRGRGALSCENAILDVDAMVTDIPDTTLCVQVADCVPVLLWDDVRGVVGAVHSGWRGTLKDITGKTVDRMMQAYGCTPHSVSAWIGPSIRGCCMRVDARIAGPVQDKGYLGLDAKGTRWDIAEACRGQLLARGVREASVEKDNGCTVCGDTSRFFSHRREGEKAGRMLAGICMVE